MTRIRTTCGIPDTLPPLNLRGIRGYCVFAGMGLFVLLVGLYPKLRPTPHLAWPFTFCWLALPVYGLWGLLKFLTRKPRTEGQIPVESLSCTRTQVGFYTVIMLGVGLGFFFWARHLGVSPPVILGSLLVIEGLGGSIMSLTEWWRLCHIGISSGLMAGGFLLPFSGKISMAAPVGGAFLLGSLVSAGILFGQVRHHETSVALGRSSQGKSDSKLRHCQQPKSS
jgi:hypothetical protein